MGSFIWDVSSGWVDCGLGTGSFIWDVSSDWVDRGLGMGSFTWDVSSGRTLFWSGGLSSLTVTPPTSGLSGLICFILLNFIFGFGLSKGFSVEGTFFFVFAPVRTWGGGLLGIDGFWDTGLTGLSTGLISSICTLGVVGVLVVEGECDWTSSVIGSSVAIIFGGCGSLLFVSTTFWMLLGSIVSNGFSESGWACFSIFGGCGCVSLGSVVSKVISELVITVSLLSSP